MTFQPLLLNCWILKSILVILIIYHIWLALVFVDIEVFWGEGRVEKAGGGEVFKCGWVGGGVDGHIEEGLVDDVGGSDISF
jgi:hypothetical protein